MKFQDAIGTQRVVVLCSSTQTQLPQQHAMTLRTLRPLVIPYAYVSTPALLATTKTKNPAQHANHVHQVLTTMKLEKRGVNLVRQVLTTMRLEDRCVKIARLANTAMKLENRLVEIVQLANLLLQQVHSNVKQCVAIQNLVIQNMKRIVER